MAYGLVAMYIVKHRTCGHIAGIGLSRDAAKTTKWLLEQSGNHGWRIQTLIGSKQTLEAALEAVANGERCDTCQVRAEATG